VRELAAALVVILVVLALASLFIWQRQRQHRP
jgi:hypothetical protein